MQLTYFSGARPHISKIYFGGR